MGQSQCFKELTSNAAVLFLVTEVSYMVQVFIASVFATCLFVRFADSNEEGCLRPASLTDGYVMPVKKFYQVNEKVSYSCSRRHYLFGDTERTCLSDGSWNGSTPHCASASKNVNLMQDEQIFGLLVDGFKGTCLNSSIISLNNLIYIRVNGFHHTVVLDIFPRPYYSNIFYEISYLNINNSFEERDYKNSLSYVDCAIDSIRVVFICDFLTLLENPLIRIKLLIEPNLVCRFCELPICEVGIFVEKENISLECWPPEVENAHWNTSNSYSYSAGTELNVECFDGYESYSNINSIMCESDGQWSAFNCTEKSPGSFNRVLIYAISAGVSIFVILALIVIIFIALKKRRKNELDSEMQSVNYIGEENIYEQMNEIKHDFQLQMKVPSNSKLEPVQINEHPPTTSNRPPSDDEAGYLAPIMLNRKKDELDKENSERSIYYNVPELPSSRRLSAEYISNLYANL